MPPDPPSCLPLCGGHFTYFNIGIAFVSYCTSLWQKYEVKGKNICPHRGQNAPRPLPTYPPFGGTLPLTKGTALCIILHEFMAKIWIELGEKLLPPTEGKMIGGNTFESQRGAFCPPPPLACPPVRTIYLFQSYVSYCTSLQQKYEVKGEKKICPPRGQNAPLPPLGGTSPFWHNIQ